MNGLDNKQVIRRNKVRDYYLFVKTIFYCQSYVIVRHHIV